MPLRGKKVVGDAHLVSVGVGAEGEQRRMLRFPPETPDAPFAGSDIDDDRGAAAHAVAVAVDRIFQCTQRIVGDGFDQTGTEEGNRHTPSEHVCIRRHDRLAGVAGHREQMEQRFACFIERLKFTCSFTRPARSSAMTPVPPTTGTL